MGLGLGLGIWWPIQTSIIPGLLKTLCARATYCENKICTTATLEEIAAVRYTAPVLPIGLLADYPGAAAAYSLRNLIDTTTSVVRVRRSSDNTEQDFTSAEITDGTLIDFCNPIGWFENIHLFQTFTSNGNNGFSGTDNAGQANAMLTIENGGVGDTVNITFDVDEITGVLGVYLLNNSVLASNRLNAVIGANSMTLTPTGNYNQISFVLTNPPSSAIVDNFTINREILGRPLNGFVTTWYDQSGNSNNATQSTALAQPKIVSNGVVLLSNNKPSLRFKEGSTRRYFNHPLTNELNSSFSILSVVKADATGSTAYEGLFTTDTMMKLSRLNSGAWGTYPGGYTNTDLYTNTINLITMISSDGNTGDFYTNNNSDRFFTDTEGQSRNSIGGIATQEFNGVISEMIIYTSDQSANRTGIETNINTEYTIY